MKLFHRLPRTVISLYKGKNALWQIAAAIITYIAVVSGFDWFYYESSRNIPLTLIFPAVLLGTFVPIIVPLVVVAWGAMRKNARLVMTGWGLGQASLLGFLISSFYKIFTGRIPPPESFRAASDAIVQSVTDISHGFQFGFLRGGVFWGWPSSHTATAFALGAAMFVLFPHRRFARWIGLAWALYVGLAVSVSIHWFSEFAAGAIIGTIIGLAVGKAFLNKEKPQR